MLFEIIDLFKGFNLLLFAAGKVFLILDLALLAMSKHCYGDDIRQTGTI